MTWNAQLQAAARCILASVLSLSSTTFAVATEGYFQNGYGARSKALAGAGVADSRDATAASLNPAGIVNAGNEFDMSVSLFNPHRQFVGGSASGFTPTGTVESDGDWFAVPNMARNWKLSGNPWFDAVALTMYGNGGMNTNYRSTAGTGGACPGFGVFCGGRAGVNLEQVMLSMAVAKRFGNVSVGVAPIFALQKFKGRGLGAFGMNGFSADPANLTNKGNDYAIGGGVRAGIEIGLAPNIRFGLAGNTPIWSQRFDKYAGLFAEQGSFNIPASVQAGIAVDLAPNFTVMADYRHIFYSGTAAVSNPSTNMALFGADNGPGFGWKDVDTIKLGVEWRTSPAFTLRAGYAYNTQPVQSRDAMLNILAPGVVQHHITGGLQYRLTSNVDLELAGMYAPFTKVTGGELAGVGGNPAHTIELGMRQFEVTAGVKYRFGP